MDATQDKAHVHVLVFSPEYLASPDCLHEMERAAATDPSFQNGSVIPLKRIQCRLPAKINRPNPLYVDMRNDRNPAPWDLLLGACQADLGVAAPSWLKDRDDIVRLLRRNQSVNLVVKGKPKWRELIGDICKNHVTDLVEVDLDRGTTASREGLIAEILRAFGSNMTTPKRPHDLAAMDKFLHTKKSASRLALIHFDRVGERNYGSDFFASLRYVTTEARKLVLLVESRRPLAAFFSEADPSSTDICEVVELVGR
jgi:hypothetical protein